MAFTLPELAYGYDALAPHISAQTMELHHSKHHQTYITNLNNFIDGTELADKSLEEIIAAVKGDASKQGLFNNAGQTLNHNIFWQCMTPNGGGKPTGAVADKIDSDLGGYDAFVEAFKQAATTQFGSGWAWLVIDTDGKLKVTNTSNGDTPVAYGQKPLIGLDVWEHAYYLDYQNVRPNYITNFLEHLVNWDYVNSQLV